MSTAEASVIAGYNGLSGGGFSTGVAGRVFHGDGRKARPLTHVAAGALSGAISRVWPEDLAVDLGDSIGSPRWWRGALTLGILCTATLSLGFLSPTAPDAPAPAPFADIAAAPGAVPAATDEADAVIHSLSRNGQMGTGLMLEPTSHVHLLSEIPERPRIDLEAKVGGDGLLSALRRSGVGRDDLEALKALLPANVALARAPAGYALNLTLGRRETRTEPRPLEHLFYRAAFDRRVEVSRGANGLGFREIPIRVDHTPLHVKGRVGRSLLQSALSAGLPHSAVAEMIRQLSHVVDVRRDVRANDDFEAVVVRQRAETGETEYGQLLYAGLRGSHQVELLRWGNEGQFFRKGGESAKQGRIAAPVAGGRVGSGYGMRFHPILGYARLHAGNDIPAATGTPIRAAAAGRVTRAGVAGGYGNLVEIDHGNGLTTRYGHMSRIMARAGQYVAQGEVIGKVGSTGLATGPHLHFEIRRNGQPLNPSSPQFLPGPRLSGQNLAAFQRRMAEVKGVELSS